jgi:hypothetical protein
MNNIQVIKTHAVGILITKTDNMIENIPEKTSNINKNKNNTRPVLKLLTWVNNFID